MAIQKLSFQWDIKNFDECDLVSSEFVHSPTFSINELTFKSDWTLRLYPAGFDFEFYNILGEIRENLTILLLRIDSGIVYHTKHSISFLDRTGCRTQTKHCSEICESSQSTTPEEILKLKNIVEIDGNALKLLDGGLLTIMCEMEIFENIDETELLVPDNRIQMRGISWFTSNSHEPIVVNLVENASSIFFLSYGNIFVRFQCGIEVDEYHEQRATFQIIDTVHTNIKKVPITIINNNNSTSTWNISIKPTPTVPFKKAKTSLQISSRCKMESKPYVVPIDLTSLRRKMQLDYRKMFSHSEGGDVTIAVDGKSLRVHKNILSNRCPVFATMFAQDQWIEQATQTVTIKEFDYNTILAMIEFIYFGGSDDWYEAVDPTNLLAAAHMYQLDDLRNKCEQRLCGTLETDNVFSNLALAETYELLNLKREEFDFITNNQIGQTDKKNT